MMTVPLLALFDNFQFAGIVPWLLVVVLFIVISILSVWLYAKHTLPRPWSWILPILRVISVGMLLLMLLQPVLQRTSSKTIRGQIPVIVDTSGSMDTIDVYQPHRQIEIGWALKFFPQDKRATVFKDEAETVSELDEMLLTAERKAGELRAALDAKKPIDSKAAKVFGKQLERISKRVDKLRDTYSDAVEDYEYLVTGPDETGGITWLRYNDISGSDIPSLTKAKKFPDQPDDRGTWPGLESKSNIGDNYGLMLHGYIIPPKDGSYTFRKQSDDASELWLSSDTSPTGASLFLPANKSDRSVKLKQGEARYIKVLLKEGVGGDFVKIGWRTPDKREEMPVPGQYLAPMSEGDANFAESWPAFAGSLQGSSTRLAELATRLEKIESGQENELKKLLNRFAEEMEAWRTLEEQPEALQQVADEALAASEDEEVDAAIERLEIMKRSDLVSVLLTQEPFNLVETLSEKGDVSVFSFAEEPEPISTENHTNLVGKLDFTRIGSTLGRVVNRFEKMPLGAVVIITDGNNNAGKPLLELRESMGERNIPVFALAVGGKEPPPDVSVARVSAPRTSFLDDTLNVSVALHRHGHLDQPIRVKVMADDKIMAEQIVEPGGEAETIVDLSFLEEQAGTRVYNVIAEREDTKEDTLRKKKEEAGEHAGPPVEAFDHNNEKALTVSILEDSIRTLCIDEYPRWETRYANMMLKRDKRVDLNTIFVASTENHQLPVSKVGGTEDGEGGGSATEKDKYPASRDALFAHSIVILGDVNPEHFTTKQMEDLRDFVIERGGTLIAMAGQHYMPSAYAGTPLADVLPLNHFGRPGQTNRLAFADHPLAFKQGAYQPSIQSEALYEDLLQIGRNPDNTKELWTGLPRLSWLKEDVTEARSSDPLVQAKAMKGDTATGTAPVAVKSYAGLGKTLYLGSDSFWRWRYRARWTYHHRFWGQVLLWSTMGRTTGSDPNIKLMSDRPVYAPEEPVVIKVRLFDENELPISNAEAEIEIRDDQDQLVKRMPLFHLENSGGEYRAEIRDLPRGSYKVIPRVPKLAHLYQGEGGRDPVEIPVEVRDLPTSEYVDLALDTATLVTLTSEVLPFEQALQVLDKIEEVKNVETIHDPIELWSRWWWLVAIALLLSLEWLLRKRCKLA